MRIKYAVILQCVKILFFARSRDQVFQNMYGQSLNDFSIFFARKYASFGHSAYCRDHYGRLSHAREKHGKSSQDFVDFHFAATQIVTECFLSIYLSIIINGKYMMIAFHLYVLCNGILNAISYAPHILLMTAEVNESQFPEFSFQFIWHWSHNNTFKRKLKFLFYDFWWKMRFLQSLKVIFVKKFKISLKGCSMG